MTKTIQTEILIPQPWEQVWRALTDSTARAEWMFPNDFAPRVGHHFTFQVPPNPKVGFDGMAVPGTFEQSFEDQRRIRGQR